ncbi:SIMPL domain-containing protein [Methanoregula sp.]|uniref:SIMPL domain-containing protein n=1 Tax=Methanoregula sp. TaxID=2052170 RepID=UPI0035657BF3
MQKLRLVMCALVLFTLAMIGCVAAADTTDHVISVSGSGTVTGTPDRVTISFSVQTENSDVKVAQASNSLTMNNVVDALAAAGVPRDQMKTTDYSITPVYQEDKGVFTNNVKTYQVTNTLRVTLKDTNQTGQMIDTAVNAGANKVDSIQFMLSDAQGQVLRSQALSKAVSNARADADTVAAALNVTITGTNTADISQGYTPVVYNRYDNLALESQSGKAASTPIQSGDITVTAQVSITYNFR